MLGMLHALFFAVTYDKLYRLTIIDLQTTRQILTFSDKSSVAGISLLFVRLNLLDWYERSLKTLKRSYQGRVFNMCAVCKYVKLFMTF